MREDLRRLRSQINLVRSTCRSSPATTKGIYRIIVFQRRSIRIYISSRGSAIKRSIYGDPSRKAGIRCHRTFRKRHPRRNPQLYGIRLVGREDGGNIVLVATGSQEEGRKKE